MGHKQLLALLAPKQHLLVVLQLLQALLDVRHGCVSSHLAWCLFIQLGPPAPDVPATVQSTRAPGQLGLWVATQAMPTVWLQSRPCGAAVGLVMKPQQPGTNSYTTIE